MRLSFCFLLILYINVFGQTDQFMFEQANARYQAGMYQEAIDLYLQVIANGKVSGEVYFNLGNAYYKSGDIGRAILYYERAKPFLEGDEALDQNIRLARLRTVDEIEPLPRLFLIEWWDALLYLLSLETLAWITYGFYLLVVILLVLNIVWHGRWKRPVWIAIWVFVPVIVIFISRVYQFETSRFGIILETKVSVMNEPNISGQEIFILHEGTKVRINRSVDNWDEISIPDGKTGWIEQKNLEVI